jgi:hypothetical protein
MLLRIPTRRHPTTLKCRLQLSSNLLQLLKSLTLIPCSLSFTTSKERTNSKCRPIIASGLRKQNGSCLSSLVLSYDVFFLLGTWLQES